MLIIFNSCSYLVCLLSSSFICFSNSAYRTISSSFISFSFAKAERSVSKDFKVFSKLSGEPFSFIVSISLLKICSFSQYSEIFNSVLFLITLKFFSKSENASEITGSCFKTSAIILLMAVSFSGLSIVLFKKV